MPKDVPKFDTFIGKLSQTHNFLGYSEATLAISKGEINRPSIAFSFDDGLQSNLVAANILERHGATAMFFVPTEFIGTATIAGAHKFFGHKTEINEPAMTWDDLEMLKARGHEIGNHTANHRTLSNIGTDEAVEEIALGADTLRRRLGECRHFAWPRGAFRFFPENLKQTVFGTGHETCSSGVRGAHVEEEQDPTQLCIRRDLVASYWPVHHSLHFVSSSSRRATRNDNFWPESARA